MKNYVVIPTYKEAENLKELLPLLKKFNVIIVDDNSGDGTDKICKKYKNTRLIVRKNARGLASAVFDGIKSITEKDAKVVIMDADFQHDPAKLPIFFKKLDTFDFVYGARKNSKMILPRRMMSKIAAIIAKLMINGIKGVDDPMSGYFGFKLAEVDLGKIKPKGYKIMLDVLINLKNRNRIGKIEYNFGDRKAGSSKMNGTTVKEFISQIIRLNDYRILKFAIVGITGIAVNELFAFLLHPFFQIYIVFSISAEISIISNFILNHEFTFKKRIPICKALPRYNAVALAGLVINVIVATYFSVYIEYLLANLVGIFMAFLFNYFLSEKFAWKEYA